MTPDEVVKKIEEIGIKTSRSTLLRFENQELIPRPERGSDGRGRGRYSEYPYHTPHEYFASYVLLNKPYRFTFDQVAKARDFALRVFSNQVDTAVVDREINEIKEVLHNPKRRPVDWFFWLTLKIMSENNFDIKKIGGIIPPTILAPVGINKVYDYIINKLFEKNPSPESFLLNEADSIMTQLAYHNYILEKAKKNVWGCNDNLEIITKLRMWHQTLNEPRKKYLYNITKIYKKNEGQRVKIEAMLLKEFSDFSMPLIQVLRMAAIEKCNDDEFEEE